MNQYSRLSKRSIVVVWFFSYMIILFFSLFFACVLYFGAEFILHRQLQQYNETISRTLLSENDRLIMENMKIATSVALNDKIKEV